MLCSKLQTVETYDSLGQPAGEVTAHCTKQEGHAGACSGIVDVEPPPAAEPVLPGAGLVANARAAAGEPS